MAGKPAIKLVEPDLERKLAALHAASFGWALICCAFDRQEAEESLQAAYLKALEGRAHFNGDSSARTWLFGIVKRTAQERRRRRAVRGLALRRFFLAEPLSREQPSPERLSHEAEVHRRLNQALIQLSRRQREILHLVFYQELTIEDAARVLGLRLGTARTHYERGKAHLRTLLSGAGDEQ